MPRVLMSPSRKRISSDDSFEPSFSPYPMNGCKRSVIDINVPPGTKGRAMETKEKLKDNEITLAEEKLEDLPVDEEHDAATKGAGTATGRVYVATDVGVFTSDE